MITNICNTALLSQQESQETAEKFLSLPNIDVPNLDEICLEESGGWLENWAKKFTCSYKPFDSDDYSRIWWLEGLDHEVSRVSIYETDTHLLHIAPKKADSTRGLIYTSRFGETLDREQRNEIAIQYAAMLSGRRDKSCINLLAIASNILYHLGECLKVFEWEELDEGKRLIGADREKVAEMLRLTKDGRFVLHASLSGTVQYINKHWPEASQSRRAIAGWIDYMEELGLLGHVEQDFVEGQWGIFRRYNFIDVERILVLCEVLDKRLRYAESETPKAGLIRTLFNAVYTGFGFGRTGDYQIAEPDTWDETDEYRRWAAWNAETDGGKYAPRKNHYPEVVKPSVKDRFNQAIEDWRKARADFGDCELVRSLKQSWQTMSNEYPYLLGG